MSPVLRSAEHLHRMKGMDKHYYSIDVDPTSFGASSTFIRGLIMIQMWEKGKRDEIHGSRITYTDEIRSAHALSRVQRALRSTGLMWNLVLFI